jgi:hypothetical protein
MSGMKDKDDLTTGNFTYEVNEETLYDDSELVGICGRYSGRHSGNNEPGSCNNEPGSSGSANASSSSSNYPPSNPSANPPTTLPKDWSPLDKGWWHDFYCIDPSDMKKVRAWWRDRLDEIEDCNKQNENLWWDNIVGYEGVGAGEIAEEVVKEVRENQNQSEKTTGYTLRQLEDVQRTVMGKLEREDENNGNNADGTSPRRRSSSSPTRRRSSSSDTGNVNVPSAMYTAIKNGLANSLSHKGRNGSTDSSSSGVWKWNTMRNKEIIQDYILELPGRLAAQIETSDMLVLRPVASKLPVDPNARQGKRYGLGKLKALS